MPGFLTAMKRPLLDEARTFLGSLMRTSTISREDWQHWHEQGFLVLADAVPLDLIDSLLQDEAEYRAKSGETKDPHGFGPRIGMFHVASSHSLGVALMPRIMTTVQQLMNDKPVVMGSLTFEVGTQQAAHVDAIYFYVEPATSMVGAWVALEDVQADAGPLFYYPGSHRWKFDRADDVWQRWPELKIDPRTLPPEQQKQHVDRMHDHWFELLREHIYQDGVKPQTALIKKGDCLIWNGNLVHGGMPRNDERLSRHSMVSHYIGEKSRLYDFPKFFLYGQGEFNPILAMPYEVVTTAAGKYRHQEKPVTY